MAKRWIQKSGIRKHKGTLRHWAQRKHFMNKNNTINLSKAKAYAEKHNLKKRVRQINLAKTLRKLH